MKNMKFWHTALMATLVLTIMLSVMSGTIAWFTSEVTTGVNIIETEGVTVKLYAAEKADYDINGDNVWNDDHLIVNGSNTPLFNNLTKWSPGSVALKYLKIDNAGDMTFNYQLNIEPVDPMDTELQKLAEVIEVYVAPAATYNNLEELKQAAIAANTRFSLKDVIASGFEGIVTGEMGSNDPSVEVVLALHMQNEAGNEYSHRKTKGFVVKLCATQTATDNGAFDNVLNPTGITGDSYTFGYYNYSRNAETRTWTVFSCTLNETEKKQIKQAARMLESINGEPVVELGASLFFDFTALESVTLPKGLEIIGNDAFKLCTKLSNINLDECTNLKTIGKRAFYQCTALSNIDLGRCTELEIIDEFAFYDCTNLSNINLDKCTNLRTIGANAFYDCKSLTKGTLPGNVTTIGTSAFLGCDSIVSITLPVSLESLGSMVFSYCTNLEIIYYKGTQTQWNAIEKNGAWNGSSAKWLKFSDGTRIELNPGESNKG